MLAYSHYWDSPDCQLRGKSQLTSNLVLTTVIGIKQAAVNDRAVAPIERASMGASSWSDFLRKRREQINQHFHVILEQEKQWWDDRRHT